MSTIKIGPMTFEIERVPRLLDDDNIKRLQGCIRYDVCRIQIERDFSPQFAKQVLWHEILHGLLVQSGQKIENEESLVESLAYGILQVLQDNPDLPSGKILE